MAKMNLSKVKYRKPKRLQRERAAICDSIYNNIVNVNLDILQQPITEALASKEDSNIFGTWDTEINTLV